MPEKKGSRSTEGNAPLTPSKGTLVKLAGELPDHGSLRTDLTNAQTVLDARQNQTSATALHSELLRIDEAIAITPITDPNFSTLSGAKAAIQRRLQTLEAEEKFLEASRRKEIEGLTVVGDLDINGRKFQFATSQNVHTLAKGFYIVDPHTQTVFSQQKIWLGIRPDQSIPSYGSSGKRGKKFPVKTEQLPFPKGTNWRKRWFSESPKKVIIVAITLNWDKNLVDLINKSATNEIPREVAGDLTQHSLTIISDDKWFWTLYVSTDIDEETRKSIGIDKEDLYPNGLSSESLTDGDAVQANTQGWARIINFNPFLFPEDRK